MNGGVVRINHNYIMTLIKFLFIAGLNRVEKACVQTSCGMKVPRLLFLNYRAGEWLQRKIFHVILFHGLSLLGEFTPQLEFLLCEDVQQQIGNI